MTAGKIKELDKCRLLISIVSKKGKLSKTSRNELGRQGRCLQRETDIAVHVTTN